MYPLSDTPMHILSNRIPKDFGSPSTVSFTVRTDTYRSAVPMKSCAVAMKSCAVPMKSLTPEKTLYVVRESDLKINLRVVINSRIC